MIDSLYSYTVRGFFPLAFSEFRPPQNGQSQVGGGQRGHPRDLGTSKGQKLGPVRFLIPLAANLHAAR